MSKEIEKPDINDPDFINELKKGNEDKYNILFDSIYPVLRKYLSRMVNSSDAEELAEDTLVRAWQNFDKYDPAKARLATWIFTIGTNLTINFINKSKNLQDKAKTYLEQETDRLNLEYRQSIERGGHLPDAGTSGAGTGNDSSSNPSNLIFSMAFNSLSEDVQGILRMIENMEIKDIAQSLNLSENATSTRIHRASNDLFDAIERLTGIRPDVEKLHGRKRKKSSKKDNE